MANIQMSTPYPPYALDPTLVPPNMSSPTPPQVMTTMGTGGNQPPLQQTGFPQVNTGGTLPPQQVTPGVNTGGTQQPIQIPGYSAPPLDGSQFVAQLQGNGAPGQSPADLVNGIAAQFGITQQQANQLVQQYGNQFNYQAGSGNTAVANMIQQFGYQPNSNPTTVAQQIAAQFNTTPDQLPIEVVQQIQAAFQGPQLGSASETTMGFMNDLLNREGSYITNARRRGLESANSRGLLNSSMAAGAGQRAALESAQPILNQIMGLNNQRESQDFQGRQNAIGQAYGLTSQREQQGFQRDMAGMQLAGDLTSMDRQAAIAQAQQAFAAANQLEGQARDAALAQARDQFSAAMNMAGQDRQNQFTDQQNKINQALGITGQREQNAFVGQQAGLDRTQGVNNALLNSQLQERQMGLANYYSKDQAALDAQLRQQLQQFGVEQQDWLNSRSFTRQFNGALSMMPIQNLYDMNNAISKYAMENPEVYTPDIISGMTNFFQMNLLGTLQQYFPQLVNTQPPGGA